jgi:hypothetical protein
VRLVARHREALGDRGGQQRQIDVWLYAKVDTIGHAHVN